MAQTFSNKDEGDLLLQSRKVSTSTDNMCAWRYGNNRSCHEPGYTQDGNAWPQYKETGFKCTGKKYHQVAGIKSQMECQMAAVSKCYNYYQYKADPKMCSIVNECFYEDGLNQKGTKQKGAGWTIFSNACAKDNAEICPACEPGYTQIGESCKANMCICTGGTPATGAACTTDNAEICESCDPGYGNAWSQYKETGFKCTGKKYHQVAGIKSQMECQLAAVRKCYNYYQYKADPKMCSIVKECYYEDGWNQKGTKQNGAGWTIFSNV